MTACDQAPIPGCRRRAVLAAIGAFSVMLSAPARAETDPERLVERSRLVLASFIEASDSSGFAERLRHAAGIFIVPSLLKAGLILGGEGGDGVVLARRDDGSWSTPAFYMIGAGSLGLQLGFQQSDVVFLFTSRRALDAVIDSSLKLGADASFAIGPLGRGIEGSTTAVLGADIIAYSRAEGLFVGGALEGAIIMPKTSWNLAYYRTLANPREILFDVRVAHPHAQPLQRLLPFDDAGPALRPPARL
ncbi:MAG: lipid-binding SYLF domain-containing protein [Alphaproteobacteria bacterium]